MHIGFSALGINAAMVASIVTLMDDPNFNLQPVLDTFYKTFQDEFVLQFPFTLLSEEEVQQNLAYQGKFNEAEDVDRNIFMQGFLTVDA
jgi:hypothetical protein